MSDQKTGMEVLRQAKENASTGGSDAGESRDSGTKEPRLRPNRSTRCPRCRRQGRSSSQTERRSKAFQFSPAEERAFKQLVIDVEEMVHEEDASVSVQNSHLVRAMVRMVADDMSQGYTHIVDYVLDEINKN